MEKGQGRWTDTSIHDEVFTRKEYIEREAAIKARNRSCKRNCAECDFAIEGDSWCEGEVFVVDLLRIPAVDVVPVQHGRWRWELADNGWANHICSVCGYTKNTDVHVRIGYNYCPNCGARMDGDGE